MIANKLNVLLAERQLTIKEVVDGTDLSRNTISNIINKNMTNSINLKTLNSLCMFLDIEPKDFFVYSPYDIYVYSPIEEGLHGMEKVFLEVIISHKMEKRKLKIEVDTKHLGNDITKIPRFANISLININEGKSSLDILKNGKESDLDTLVHTINSLDIMFKRTIERKIEEEIKHSIEIKCSIKECSNKQAQKDPLNSHEFIYSYPWGTKKDVYYVDHYRE